MRNVFLIASVAVQELIYERVFYLWMIFVLFSVGMSLLLGQLTYAEQAKLTIDFMLGGIEISMLLFAVFMGIFLFQREITLGSIHMVLSKPISRTSFLLGKFLGQVFVEFFVILAMAGVTMLLSLRFGGGGFALGLFQASILIFFEVVIITAATYFFAVNAGAIFAAVAALSIFCLGHLRTGVTSHVEYHEGEINWGWNLIKGILPNLEVFNMKALAAYGHTISWVGFGWAALYGLVCVVFFLLMANICFEHKDIQA